MNESPFKKMVASDIKEVFINFSEFADWHEINGEQILCVIDTDVTQKFDEQSRIGIMTNQIRLFIQDTDLIPAPVQGELISVDGSHHRVDSVSVEDGVLVVLATAVNE